MKFYLELLSFWMSFKSTPKKITDYLETYGTTDKNNTAYATPETVRAACVQLCARPYKSLREYLAEMLRLTRNAVDNGAQFVVFPEYTGLLAATMLPDCRRLIRWVTQDDKPTCQDAIHLHPERLNLLCETFHNFLYETYMYTFGTLARIQKVYIVAGTCLFYEQGKLYNRCIVFGPNGEAIAAQDKTSPIGFDRALGVVPSDELEVIHTPICDIGVIIGSDAYYFEYFKILKEQGAQMIAVPDSREGIVRDLLKCRAQEQDIFTLYACLAGQSTDSAARAGIFAPIGAVSEHDGVVVQCESADAEVVTARTNLTKLEGLIPVSEPNHRFLTGDYMHSYRYCGALPIAEPDA